jgi:diacylglycerol kinase family enzyme
MRQTTLILLECRSQETPAVPMLWRHYATEIAEALSPLELVQVAGPEEAEAAAFDSAILGFTRIVAVGGPAVAHGLINGIMRLAEGHRRRMKIGFLSLGPRGPWARTVGLPSELKRQLEILAAGHTLPYDVGHLECVRTPEAPTAPAGTPIGRYFLLGAACGPLSASWSLAALPPLHFARIAGSLVSSGVRCLAGKMPQVALEVDGREVYRGPWALGLVMGGRHYPLLGETAPEANPSDGTLDVTWIPAASLLSMTGRALALWLGGQALPGHDLLPAPPRCRGSEIRIVPLGGASTNAQLVEADGVRAGVLPATIRIVPRTLPLIVETVAARMRQKLRATADLPEAALAGGLRAISLRRSGFEDAGLRPLRVRRRGWRGWNRKF